MPRIFRLNKIPVKSNPRHQPQSQIIKPVYCDKCNTRATSNINTGFTTDGNWQLWCENCQKNILVFELHGDIRADVSPHGRFGKRAKRGGKQEINDFTMSSKDLEKIKEFIDATN